MDCLRGERGRNTLNEPSLLSFETFCHPVMKQSSGIQKVKQYYTLIVVQDHHYAGITRFVAYGRPGKVIPLSRAGMVLKLISLFPSGRNSLATARHLMVHCVTRNFRHNHIFFLGEYVTVTIYCQLQCSLSSFESSLLLFVFLD